MNITSATNGTTTTIAVDGWLDTSSAPNLSNEINRLDASCKELVIDFANLEYISSAGLRVLVSAHKQMRGNLTITHVSPEVMQILHMAGFDRRLNIA